MRLALMIPALLPIAAEAALRPLPPAPSYRSGEVLVQYRDGARSAVLAKARLGLTAKLSLPAAQAELLQLPSMTDVPAALELLRADPSVALAEPNYLRRPLAVTPNDPLFGEQWGLRNTGQANFFAGGPAGVVGGDMNLANAWDASGDGIADRTGDGSVTVAVIDDGFALRHPDLIDNFIAGFDTRDNDGDPSGSSSDSHGTLVSGCVGARGNNGIGVAGVAWNVKLLPIRFGFDTASAIAAYDYARTRGAKVVNASFGGPGFSQLEKDTIARLRDADVLFVAAAGNNDSNIDESQLSYPANYGLANIVSVAATNRQDQIASYSQYGPTTVDIAAPGLQIVTTQVDGGYATSPGVTGTSFASPYTAGAAALIRMSYPAADYRETKARLLEGTQAGGDVGLRVASGRLDVDAALDLAARPNLVISSVRLIDGGNGVLDPGESAMLEFTVANRWLAAANVLGTLSIDGDAASTSGGSIAFGNIARDGSASARFPISLPSSASGFRQLRLRLALSADGGYTANRGALLGTGRLLSGQSASQTIQTDLYDEFQTWHIEVPAGQPQLRFRSSAGQDIDLLVKRGSPARYLISLDVDPDTGDQVFETDADRVGGDESGNEDVRIDQPAAGTWFVTVVNYAQVDNTPYRLVAEYGASTGPAGGGSGGGALMAWGLLPPLLWRWRRRIGAGRGLHKK